MRSLGDLALTQQTFPGDFQTSAGVARFALAFASGRRRNGWYLYHRNSVPAETQRC